jgi:hypothetical protein
VDRERISQAQQQFSDSLALDRARLEQAESQFGRSFGYQQQQGQQDLAFKLAQIFAGADDPAMQAQGRTVIQMLMQNIPGFAAMMGGNPPAGTPPASPPPASPPPASPPPASPPPAAPPAYTPPTYNPPATNPYNNPLGPTSGNEDYSYSPIDFGEILRFGENTYNPYGYY